MKKRSLPASNIGSASLLMTFIVLCLVIFAVLSLSSAVSEYKYTQKLAQHNTEYYEASNTATEKLKEIDEALQMAYMLQSTIPVNAEAYHIVAENLLSQISQITTDFSGEQPMITFEVPMNDSQALQVILKINPPKDFDNGFYKISSWQEIAVTQWSGDDSLNLFMPAGL